MSYIDTDIKKLYGVGEARAKAYSALGISTVSDLISHYPRGYEDRGDIKLIAEVDDYLKHAFILTVATEPKSARVKGNMTITKFRAYDESATCEIVFFNQDCVTAPPLVLTEYRLTVALGNAFAVYDKVFSTQFNSIILRAKGKVHGEREFRGVRCVKHEVAAILKTEYSKCCVLNLNSIL